jgi:hypothetical protein
MIIPNEISHHQICVCVRARVCVCLCVYVCIYVCMHVWNYERTSYTEIKREHEQEKRVTCLVWFLINEE